MAGQVLQFGSDIQWPCAGTCLVSTVTPACTIEPLFQKSHFGFGVAIHAPVLLQVFITECHPLHLFHSLPVGKELVFEPSLLHAVSVQDPAISFALPCVFRLVVCIDCVCVYMAPSVPSWPALHLLL